MRFASGIINNDFPIYEQETMINLGTNNISFLNVNTLSWLIDYPSKS